jgi:hypothetical protein
MHERTSERMVRGVILDKVVSGVVKSVILQSGKPCLDTLIQVP